MSGQDSWIASYLLMAANLQDWINWPKTETELSSGRNTNVFKIVNSTYGWLIEFRLFWTFLSASLYNFKAQPLTHIQMKPNLILTWICCSIRDKARSHFEMIFQWHLKIEALTRLFLWPLMTLLAEFDWERFYIQLQKVTKTWGNFEWL